MIASKIQELINLLEVKTQNLEEDKNFNLLIEDLVNQLGTNESEATRLTRDYIKALFLGKALLYLKETKEILGVEAFADLLNNPKNLAESAMCYNCYEPWGEYLSEGVNFLLGPKELEPEQANELDIMFSEFVIPYLYDQYSEEGQAEVEEFEALLRKSEKDGSQVIRENGFVIVRNDIPAGNTKPQKKKSKAKRKAARKARRNNR